MANHPTEIAETLGGAGLLLGGAGALGLFGDLGAGAAAGAADVGASTGGTLAADLGINDIGAAAAADSAAFAPAAGDALAFAPDALAPEAVAADPIASMGGVDLSGGTGLSSFSPDAVTPGSYSWTAADIQGPGIGSSVTADPNVMAYENPAYNPGGGVTGTLNSIMSSPYTKLAAGVAPLALALGMGQPSLPSQLGPAAANAAALASQGSALNPSQTATLQQMKQDAVNAARQALFNQGVQNPEADTRWAQMTSNIDSQVTAAAQTMIQQNIQNSLAGDQQLIQIAQLQMQSDQNFTNMLVNATKSLGTAFGSGTTIRIGS